MEKYFTSEEIAKRYGVTKWTVWSWVREKKIRAIKVGRSYMITTDALKEFENERMTM